MDTLLEQASPLPWHVRGKREVESAGGTVVVCGNYNEYGCSPGIDAELIVRAVNAYEPLVKALQHIASLGTDAPSFGGDPGDFYRDQLWAAIGTAARALATVESSPEREGGE